MRLTQNVRRTFIIIIPLSLESKQPNALMFETSKLWFVQLMMCTSYVKQTSYCINNCTYSKSTRHLILTY